MRLKKERQKHSLSLGDHRGARGYVGRRNNQEEAEGKGQERTRAVGWAL